MVNGTIIHYSRRHPKTGEISATLDWMRITCPWNESLSVHKDWVPVQRPVWTSEELLKRVNAIPQLLNNSPAELDQFHQGRSEKGEPEDI